MALKRSKPKTARAVHANRGVEAAYRRRLMRLIDRMVASVERFAVAQWRKTPPRMTGAVELAEDARPPAEFMRVRLEALRKQWVRQFDDSAGSIAEGFVSDISKASDVSLRASLRDAGWSVKFDMTPTMRDALDASISENIGLIKSIPAQYLDRVEGAVMRGYTAGRDLEAITKELRSIYPITARRAALIARDQSNKANGVVNRARQLELGITKAIWQHSHAGKQPRPSHVKADGKEYEIVKGMYLDGEWVLPGQLVNCRCSSRPVLPF